MKDIISRHKAGEHIGICSVCSAHPLVIEAALRFDLHTTTRFLSKQPLIRLTSLAATPECSLRTFVIS
ncbi:Tagatose-6-phosphate kinase GatZ [Klebsiella grimontii]|uniref:Tagatose-6-phosphate kinase GatZ n=1 Tax=Klebsiella grimontii TaxID=2058152 RepID=A0A7H4NW51_9ENTR|nr:Tagatose-6-phosphate kinase GatZ [Klebsiella grimontii]